MHHSLLIWNVTININEIPVSIGLFLDFLFCLIIYLFMVLLSHRNIYKIYMHMWATKASHI